MRRKLALIGLGACALAACADRAPSRLGYVPPADQPAQPGAGYVGQPAAELIWDQLLDRLTQAGLTIALADPDRGIMVATYSGDPAPYVDCGWILLHGGGPPERIDASSEASFSRMIGGRSFEIGRDLRLDARLVVQIRPEGGHAFVDASSNYVLTKIVVADARAGWRRARSYETVSFSTGERGEFSKGTVCQPNGELERIVLDILPDATLVAERTPTTLPATTRRATIVETEIPSDDLERRAAAESGRGQQAEGSALEPAAPPPTLAAPGAPAQGEGTQEATGTDLEQPAPAPSDSGRQDLAARDLGQQAPAAGASAQPATERDLGRQSSPAQAPGQQDAAALSDLERGSCATADDEVFCEVLEITAPYRRANEERGLGLEVDEIESGNPLLADGGLGLDISLPRYQAYLTVSFFMRDGTVRHVRSGTHRRWPANAREFVADAGPGEQGAGVEMVVAVASEAPLFASPRPPTETAASYLPELRRRLAEMSEGAEPAEIAASLVVITPGGRQPS